MHPWLTIIGIGEDGLQGLNVEAYNALKNAAVVYGGERHLMMAQSVITGEKRAWPKPFLSVVEELQALRGRPVTVLASGNPLFYGVGGTLMKYFSADEMKIYFQPSSFSLAAAKMGWPLQDVACLSLVGCPINLLKAHIQDGRKLLILPSDGVALALIAEVFENMGAGETLLTIFENLGGAKEKITRSIKPEEAKHLTVGNLYVIAAECRCASSASYPMGTILPDSAFQNDGQLTKHDIRAVSLSYLSPRYGQLLWDVGAGSGSISIEWLRAAPQTRAFAIEKNKDRARSIATNAENIGVSGLNLFEGEAANIIPTLEAPDTVFIGGGFTEGNIAEACWKAIKPGGRLVANGVTLETEAAFQEWIKRYGGRLVKLSIAAAAPLGGFHIWRQALPVTILISDKV